MRAPTTLPCSAWSSELEGTAESCSPPTDTTAVAAFLRSSVPCCPVTTMPSSCSTSFFNATSTVLLPAGTNTVRN